MASDFLRALIKAVPYEIHTVLTNNGQQFCHAPRNRSGPTARYSMHMFDRVGGENGIEHRLTKPNHPWTSALSLDLPVRVVAAVASGLTHREASERFGVSAASVSRWRALERAHGEPSRG